MLSFLAFDKLVDYESKIRFNAFIVYVHYSVVLGHLMVPFFVFYYIFRIKQILFLQGTRDAETDGPEKGDQKGKASPFEEDQNRDLKQGDDDDSKINGRGLPNGMDADCKDFK